MKTLIVTILSVLLLGSCCHCNCDEKPVPMVTVDCTAPEIVTVNNCLQGCTNPTCVMGCCSRLNTFPGTVAEREGARRCVAQCTPK
jgi:hypothetical protein